MELWEFIQKHIKTKVDYDKAYGAQCVDLFRQYCNDVLEVPHTGAVEGAKDLFLNYEKLPKEMEYFKKTKGLSGIKSGDVLIYDATKTNKYGHVAIFISKEGNDAVLFEQNGFAQDGAKLVKRSLTGVLGYLRFKK